MGLRRLWKKAPAPSAPPGSVTGDELARRARACETTEDLKSLLHAMEPTQEAALVVLAHSGGWDGDMLREQMAHWNNATAYNAVAANPRISSELKEVVRTAPAARLVHHQRLARDLPEGPAREAARGQVLILANILARNPTTTVKELPGLVRALKHDQAGILEVVRHPNADCMVVAEALVDPRYVAVIDAAMDGPHFAVNIVQAFLRSLADTYPHVMARLLLYAAAPSRQRTLWPALRLHWPALADEHPELLAAVVRHVPADCLAMLTPEETTRAMASHNGALRSTMIELLAVSGTEPHPVLPSPARPARTV